MFDITQIQPVSAIISAVITASVSFLIAYFLVAKRKKLGIRVLPTEELTSALRGHNRVISVSVDGQPFLMLNRCLIEVRNTGNTSIEKLSFTVEIPMEHNGCLCEVAATNRALYDAIKISRQASTHNPTFDILVETFLNPEEEFHVIVFFDGQAVRCNVQCRVPETKVKIRYGSPPIDFRRASWYAKAFIIFVAGFLVLQVGFVAFLLGAILYSFSLKAVAFWHFLANLQ